jgi:archaellum component FlaC
MPVEKIPSWIEHLLLPKLSTIEGELKAINTRIDSVEDRVGSLRNEMLSKFEATDNKIDSLRNEMLSKFEGVDIKITSLDERIISLRNETKIELTSLRTEMSVRLDSLEKRIPVIEEITALKLKIADIEKRLAVV